MSLIDDIKTDERLAKLNALVLLRYKPKGNGVEKPIQEYTKEELAKYLNTENEVAVELIYDLCLKEEPDTEYHLVVGQDEEPPTWDAENENTNVIDTLINKGYGKPTGGYGLSGFCIYPDIPGYEAYDKDRLPFVIDIKAFFRVSNFNLAASRVYSVPELKEQLTSIVKENLQKAQEAEFLAKQEIELKQQDAERQVGLKQAAVAQEVAEKELEVKRVREIQAAEIEKQAATVKAQQDKAVIEVEAEASITKTEAEKKVAILNAEAEKQRVILNANAQKEQIELDAQARKTQTELKADADLKSSN
ncbi:unnamed protein product [Cylicocyclus nassatus]|uniref:Uncharacterized protein n=1 Tax=Cylicocyclus nassatus TaxID=53992 RepID=A0AA36DR18_CYLNA|nr:unnamed protein product [Cylicocyclus nassatus]